MFGNTADDLAAHIESILTAIEAGDIEAAARMNQAMVPSPEQALALLSDDLPEGFADALSQMLTRLPPRDDRRTWAQVLRIPPGERTIEVFTATGSELRAGEVEGFPPDAHTAASVLQPDRAYHQVRTTLADRPQPAEVHLVTWGDDGWTMIGPVWRLRR